MQRTVKAVGFTIEWVLTAVSDCGTMPVVVDVSEFPDCSTIFIWTTIEWVLTAVSDCGTMPVVVDVSEFPDCSTIFIWTTIEWVLTVPVSCAILAVQRSTTVFRLGNCSPSR